MTAPLTNFEIQQTVLAAGRKLLARCKEPDGYNVRKVQEIADEFVPGSINVEEVEAFSDENGIFIEEGVEGICMPQESEEGKATIVLKSIDNIKGIFSRVSDFVHEFTHGIQHKKQNGTQEIEEMNRRLHLNNEPLRIYSIVRGELAEECKENPKFLQKDKKLKHFVLDSIKSRFYSRKIDTHEKVKAVCDTLLIRSDQEIKAYESEIAFAKEHGQKVDSEILYIKAINEKIRRVVMDEVVDNKMRFLTSKPKEPLVVRIKSRLFGRRKAA